MGRRPKCDRQFAVASGHPMISEMQRGPGRARASIDLPSSARLGFLGRFSQSDPVVLRGAAVTLRMLPVESRCAALRQVLTVLVAVLVTFTCELSAVHLTLAGVGPRITGLGNGITTVRSLHDLAGRLHPSGQSILTLRQHGLAPVEFGLAILDCSL